jgi:hypothetical protein
VFGPTLTFREIKDASKMTRRCGSEEEHQTVNDCRLAMSPLQSDRGPANERIAIESVVVKTVIQCR